MNNNSCVYEIICTKNNKKYIGSSKNIRKRKQEHLRDLNSNSHHSDRLQNDWNKYGPECFKFNILEYCDENEKYDLEQKYLDKFKSYEEEYGYNISPISRGVKKFGKENSFYGKHHTVESRKLMSLHHYDVSGKNNPNYGKKCSESTKAKISAANKGRKWTEEQRKKLSESHKKRVFTHLICITTGKEFNSIESAKDFYNIKNYYKNYKKYFNGEKSYWGKLKDGTPLQWKKQ